MTLPCVLTVPGHRDEHESHVIRGWHHHQSHASTPAGQPEGPTELAALTFVLTRELESNLHSTCPRWPQIQTLRKEEQYSKQLLGEPKAELELGTSLHSISGSPSAKFLQCPLCSHRVACPSTSLCQKHHLEGQIRSMTSGQAGIWKRSPKKPWLFKTLHWKQDLCHKARFQSLKWFTILLGQAIYLPLPYVSFFTWKVSVMVLRRDSNTPCHVVHCNY